MLARTPRRPLDGFTKPYLFLCRDGREYVVKGSHNGRLIVNDHIVSRLGMALGAPVATVGLVNLPAQLIIMTPELYYFPPGVCHGSVWVDGCGPRDTIRHVHIGENRRLFAYLAILYGWTGASDRQVIYRHSDDHAVLSVDHGEFFPDEGEWTIESLQSTGYAHPDPDMLEKCQLRPADLQMPLAQLERLSEKSIAQAVAAPPDEWGCSIDERVALASYLERRRSELIAR